VIGDSHIRNAASEVKVQLKKSGWTPTVRCWGGKRLDWGRAQVARAKKLNQLPENVVIALGTNDMRWIDRRVTRSRMAALVDQIGPKRNIFWVETYAGNADRFSKSKQKWFNDEVRKLARKHPNVRVVPWESGARRSGVRFVDGLHYRGVDYRLMVKFIADELNSVLTAADPPEPSLVAPPIA
jgi:lysophospholipase L1-like esterase